MQRQEVGGVFSLLPPPPHAAPQPPDGTQDLLRVALGGRRPLGLQIPSCGRRAVFLLKL